LTASFTLTLDSCAKARHNRNVFSIDTNCVDECGLRECQRFANIVEAGAGKIAVALEPLID
jgi:hypothetical protein